MSGIGPVAARRRATAALLPALALLVTLALGLALAACGSSRAIGQPRPLTAPVDSARSFFERFVSPAAIGRDVADMRTTADGMVDGALEFEATGKTLGRIAGREVDGPQRVVAGARRLTASEADRLGQLTSSPVLEHVSPEAMTARLRDGIDTVPRVLDLGRRPLGEPSDIEHRTDPGDLRPEVGWLHRILRRIAP